MTQCTCTKDKEATCIVHPTTQSLKDYIAELEGENEEIQHSLDCMVAATWELQKGYNALREAAHEAQEIYAGMEGFIPRNAEAAYTIRIIEQMYKALLQEGE